MSDDGLESLAFAKRFKGWIASEVAAQLQRLAPQRRIAEVVSIDTVNRRAGVIYVGETNEVSLPYNLAVPAYVGQYVAVDGPPQDRSIVDVLGASGIEKRMEENHAATPLPPYWAAPQLDALETFPSRLRAFGNTYEHAVDPGTMAFTPVRAQVDGLFSRAAIRLLTTGSADNRINIAVYKILPNGDFVLLGATADLVPFGGTMLADLDTEISVQRGDMLTIGVRVSGTGSRPALLALQHTVSPLPLGTDYTVATTSVSSVPPSVAVAQLSFSYVVTVWSALLR